MTPLTKAKRDHLRVENAKYGTHLVACPLTDQPEPMLARRVAAWRSRDFLVQMFDEGDWERFSVNRTMVRNDGDWVAEISWDDLMEIKRQLGYGDRLALEVLPREEDVQNVANMRHFWIHVDPTFSVGWRRDDLTQSERVQLRRHLEAKLGEIEAEALS